MDTQKIESYRGFAITYDVEESLFRAESTEPENPSMEAETLKALRAKIDKLDEEPKVKQPKQKAIQLETQHGKNWAYSIKEKIVGAFGQKRRWSRSDVYELYAWITDAKGRNRERVRMDESYRAYYEDTPDNRQRIEKIIALGEEITAFYNKKTDEQEALLEKLTRVKPKIERDTLPTWNQ